MQSSNSFPDDYLEKMIQTMNSLGGGDSKCKLPEEGFFAVSEDVILEFFNKHVNNPIIINVLELLADEAITDKVFEWLMRKLSGKLRNEVVILLSHYNLKSSQLFYLCKEDLTFECYYTLGERLYENSEITEESFNEFMLFFSKSTFKDHIKYFCENYLKREKQNKKENVIENFCTMR